MARTGSLHASRAYANGRSPYRTRSEKRRQETLGKRGIVGRTGDEETVVEFGVHALDRPEDVQADRRVVDEQRNDGVQR